jgi:type IV pilus assembly protein PilV
MNALSSTRVLRVAYPGSRGLTLVEILIALLILSVGLLGLAGLQTLSLKFNTSAYYRTQATALAYDFADRMRANRQEALAGLYNVVAQNPPPACGEVVVNGAVADEDIATWRDALSCRIPQSTGAVALDAATNEVTITVRWTDPEGDDDMDFEFRTAL